ncbi:hypothetical protein RB195_020807 [Necator americanus]|uniref:Cysteine rich repeat-containing domain protein n=1 Tax=Necator americanus TaxID=51031 RepID=A0ABR1CLS0_NECAM
MPELIPSPQCTASCMPECTPQCTEQQDSFSNQLHAPPTSMESQCVSACTPKCDPQCIYEQEHKAAEQPPLPFPTLIPTEGAEAQEQTEGEHSTTPYPTSPSLQCIDACMPNCDSQCILEHELQRNEVQYPSTPVPESILTEEPSSECVEACMPKCEFQCISAYQRIPGEKSTESFTTPSTMNLDEPECVPECMPSCEPECVLEQYLVKNLTPVHEPLSPTRSQEHSDSPLRVEIIFEDQKKVRRTAAVLEVGQLNEVGKGGS